MGATHSAANITAVAAALASASTSTDATQPPRGPRRRGATESMVGGGSAGGARPPPALAVPDETETRDSVSILHGMSATFDDDGSPVHYKSGLMAAVDDEKVGSTSAFAGAGPRPRGPNSTRAAGAGTLASPLTKMAGAMIMGDGSEGRDGVGRRPHVDKTDPNLSTAGRLAQMAAVYTQPLRKEPTSPTHSPLKGPGRSPTPSHAHTTSDKVLQTVPSGSSAAPAPPGPGTRRSELRRQQHGASVISLGEGLDAAALGHGGSKAVPPNSHVPLDLLGGGSAALRQSISIGQLGLTGLPALPAGGVGSLAGALSGTSVKPSRRG
jgi:hypothetical protein